MAEKIARTYGCAVFSGIKETGKLKEMYGDIQTIREVFAANGEFMQILLHPDIQTVEKEELVKKAFYGHVLGDLYGLMELLIEKGRISYLDEILDMMIALYKEEMGIGVVSVKTVRELGYRQEKALEAKLLESTGYKKLEISYEIDESLIGGLVIRIGDRVCDSSVATRLQNMTRQLKTLQIK